MKICGIVAEYNPFHNGHEYHLKRTKEISGADYVVLCMSGDFVQRGIPAISDKYSRAEAALRGGADVVIELPVVFSTASAEYFANGAVSLLDRLGCDLISFGSETGNIDQLRIVAEVYSKAERDHFNEISFLISEGNSYVKALNEVCRTYYAIDEQNLDPASNDKLGIAYLRTIEALGSSMGAVAVKREGSDYLDDGAESDSAMAIRSTLRASSDPWTIKDKIPEYSYNALFENKFRSCPVYANDFSDMLYMKLRSISESSNNMDEFMQYLDVSQNIAGKIIKNLNSFSAFDRFAYSILSSEYTISRMNRSLLHILLDIKAADVNSLNKDTLSPYARVIGFRRDSSELLSELKKRSKTAIITKMADAHLSIPQNSMWMFERDNFAADLYEHVAACKYDRDKINEMVRSPIIV